MRSFSPDCTPTYRSRGTESNLTSPVAGITRTSIMVSERVDSPSDELGLRSTPRTSTSSGSPEACSASLAAASLAASSLASLAASFLASSLACFLAWRASLRADWSLVSVASSRLRPDSEKQTGQNKARQEPPPTVPRPPKPVAFRTCSASSLLQGPPPLPVHGKQVPVNASQQNLPDCKHL